MKQTLVMCLACAACFFGLPRWVLATTPEASSIVPDGLVRCDPPLFEAAQARCRDPQYLESEAERLRGIYLAQVMSEPFLARLEGDRKLSARLLAAVVSLGLENSAGEDHTEATRERTDHHWQSLTADYPESLPAQIGSLGYCACRDEAPCVRRLTETLLAFHPDNAWGAILMGTDRWNVDGPTGQAWFHEAAHRQSASLGVWESVLLIHDALLRHIEPVADDPLEQSPAALVGLAMGVAATSVHPHLRVQQACAQADSDADFEACLAAARAMDLPGDLILTRTVSLGMQEQFLARLGRPAEAEAVNQEREILQSWANETTDVGPNPLDAEAALRFLQTSADRGEIDARRVYGYPQPR